MTVLKAKRPTRLLTSSWPPHDHGCSFSWTPMP